MFFFRSVRPQSLIKKDINHLDIRELVSLMAEEDENLDAEFIVVLNDYIKGEDWTFVESIIKTKLEHVKPNGLVDSKLNELLEVINPKTPLDHGDPYGFPL